MRCSNLLFIVFVATLFVLETISAEEGTRSNDLKLLLGVNNEWVNPLSFIRPINKTAFKTLAPYENDNGLPYTSTTLLSALKAMRIGQYRFPGGSISNHWNFSKADFSKKVLESSAPQGEKLRLAYNLKQHSEHSQSFGYHPRILLSFHLNLKTLP